MDTIEFIKMTFAEYKALSDIAPKTFYYITDTEDLYQGEKLLNAKFWEGTQAQYSAAIANGEIPDGTIVKITDSSVPTGSDITIDSALSSTSENPVQNKVINTALNGKLGTSGNGENVTVDTFTTSSASMPTLTAGETLKVLFGKLVKWMSDVATVLTSKSASSGGTDTSLVTTGEKYTWNNKVDSVSVGYTGTASSSAVRYQRIGVADAGGSTSYTEVNGTKYMETTITTSTSASVNATFSNSAITTSSVIDVYTSQYGLNHSNITISSGSCTVTFPAQSSAATVTVRIYIR